MPTRERASNRDSTPPASPGERDGPAVEGLLVTLRLGMMEPVASRVARDVDADGGCSPNQAVITASRRRHVVLGHRS